MSFDILDVVTIKKDAHEIQFSDRIEAFLFMQKHCRGKRVEVTYHSNETFKLISEFFSINKQGVVRKESSVNTEDGLNLAC